MARRIPFIILLSESPGTAHPLLQQLAGASEQGRTYHVLLVAQEGVSQPERQLIQQYGWQRQPGSLAEAQAALTAHKHRDSYLLRTGEAIPTDLLPEAPPAPPAPSVVPSPPPAPAPEAGHLVQVPRGVPQPVPAPATVWETPRGKRAAFLVATSHRPLLLEACLRHLVTQAVPQGWQMEILVGGEARDPGARVCQMYQPLVRFVGVGHSRVTDKLNALALETRADLLLMADDDDLQPINRLKAAVQMFDQGCAWSASGLHRFVDLKTGQVARWTGKSQWGLVGTSIAITRELFLKVGGYPSVAAGKDGHLAYRVGQQQPQPKFGDVGPLIGEGLICLQHGKNINTRPFPPQGEVTTKGKFEIKGEGSWSSAQLPHPVRETLTALLAPTPVPVPVPALTATAEPPLTCTLAGAGQSAFIDGLLELGFKGITIQEVARALERGQHVLGHGWWGGFPQFIQNPNFHTLWHSGYAGSDLMGEGSTLTEAVKASLKRPGALLWLESRDVAPPGAVKMTPVWSPARMAALAEPRPPKIPNTVLVGFHGKYPSNAKNILASIAGAAATTGTLHLSRSSLEGARGAAVEALLQAFGGTWTAHDFLPRQEAVRLVASMTVMAHVSLSDTWPYLVMESVYAGTPVIVSDMVDWTRHLSDWAKTMCLVTPVTSSDQIRAKIQHLLDSPKDRNQLVLEQKEVLDKLAPVMLGRASQTLKELGFPVQQPVSKGLPVPIPVQPPVPKATPAPESPASRKPAAPQVGPPKVDLRDWVTVFVIASGEPSVQACHDHLDRQDSLFQRQNIYHVTPMWRAFQQMLDRCKTPYYVQVDADMLLEPWAVRELYEAITIQDSKVAQVVGWLWDDDVERPIQGVKVYRHDICSQYPYGNELSCEMGQNRALTDAGYRIVSLGLGDQHTGSKWTRTRASFGTHYASQNPAMAFERWQRLMQKHRKLLWMGWLGEYPERLEQRWLADPTNQIAKARYLGCIAGLTGPIPEGERDASLPNQDYRRVAAYVGEYSKGPVEATLYLTDRCNFKCVFGETPCKRQAEGGIPMEGNLTPGFLRSFLQAYPTLRSVCFAGFGEPLLHPQLPQLVQVCAEHTLFVGLISNGSLVAKNAKLLQGLPLGYLSVSLNATTAGEHHEMSRTKMWDSVLEGIKVMAASKIRTGISYVVTNHNTKRLPDLLRLCRDLGVKFIHLHNVLPHAGVDNLGFLNDVLTPTSAEALADIEAAKKLPGAELVEVWPQVVDLQAGPPGKCLSPFVSIGIDSKGNISGCRRVDPPETSFGGCFSPAWRNGHYATLIAQITGDRPGGHPACMGCFGNWKG